MYKDVLTLFLEQYGIKAFDFLVYSKNEVHIVDKYGNILEVVKFKDFERFVFETLSGEKY